MTDHTEARLFARALNAVADQRRARDKQPAPDQLWEYTLRTRGDGRVVSRGSLVDWPPVQT